MIGIISKDDDSALLSQVDSFVNHCDANYLEMNVSKTKEMVIDFRQIQNPSKAAWPDKLSPRVLKLCSNQLAYIFSVLYTMSFSFSNRSIPAIWKKSCIIQVPKKPAIYCMNDFRQIALTSVPIKVCECLVLNDLKLKVAPHSDFSSAFNTIQPHIPVKKSRVD